MAKRFIPTLGWYLILFKSHEIIARKPFCSHAAFTPQGGTEEKRTQSVIYLGAA
jgi:hypothetical protein